MSLGDPPFGQCCVCGQVLTAGHQCTPLFPRIAEEQRRGLLELPRLTEEDVRRIVREELKKANIGVKYHTNYGPPRRV
jgi:hypothetical protein